MITPQDFTRINNDVNGNPRYVCHYNHFCTDAISEQAKKDSQNIRPFKFFVDYEYKACLLIANKIGGRKFHNKQYGGGIVFQSYNLQDLCNRINQLTK